MYLLIAATLTPFSLEGLMCVKFLALVKRKLYQFPFITCCSNRELINGFMMCITLAVFEIKSKKNILEQYYKLTALTDCLKVVI